MNTVHTNGVTWQIRFVFFVMATALSFAWSANMAHADTTQQTSQVSIASSGQVMVKGAIVTSVNGSIIMAKAVWRATSFIWTINSHGNHHGLGQ